MDFFALERGVALAMPRSHGSELRTPAPDGLELAPAITASTFTELGIDLIDPASRKPEQIDAEGLVLPWHCDPAWRREMLERLARLAQLETASRRACPARAVSFCRIW